MSSELNIYLEGLTSLNRGRTKYGLGPHKPILIISLIELIEKGIIWYNQIQIDSVLASTFKENWDLLVNTENQADITLPIYHLKNDTIEDKEFWRLISFDGTQIQSYISSINTLAKKVAYAEFSTKLFALLSDPLTREIIKETLVNFYFPTTKKGISLEEKMKYDKEKLERYILQEPEVVYRKFQNPKLEFEMFIRNGNFKKFIPMIYSSKCSFTGMQTTSIFSHSLVDACHIIPFSINQDDNIDNGLALSPTMHRAFDAGLISVDKDYKILISNIVIEDKNYHYSLSSLSNKHIFLPSDKKLYPSQEKLEWHRRIRFKK